MKYIKKPVVIEAIQWTGNNPIDIGSFCGKYATFDADKNLLLTTLENTKENYFECSLNDFIIKGIKGEFYACKPDIFEMTYESLIVKETYVYKEIAE